MTEPKTEIKSQLAFWNVVGLCEYFQISPAIAIIDPDFGESIAIKTLMFCRILANFEDLCVVHVGE